MKPKTVSRLLLWSCYCSMLSIAASVNVTPICLSSLSETFHLDYAQQGLLLGCTFWGYIIALLIVAPLSDRYGPSPFFVLASLLQVAGFGVLALAWSPIALAAGATLTGLGGGALETMLTPVVCELYPERRTSAVNILHSFYAIGAVGVVLLSRFILQHGSRMAEDGQLVQAWRWAYAAMLLLPVIQGVGFWICFRVRGLSVSYPHSESLTGSLKRLRRLGFAAFAVGMFCVGGTELGAAQWLPTYMEKVMAWSRENSAHGLIVLSFGMWMGRFFTGRVAHYISSAGVLILSGAVCAICLVVAGTAESGSVVLVTFGVMGFFVGWMWPTTLAIASEAFPTTGSTMFALLAVAGNAGGIVFPGAMGFIADEYGLRFAMGSLSLVPCVVTLVFLVWLLRQRGRIRVPGS